MMVKECRNEIRVELWVLHYSYLNLMWLSWDFLTVSPVP